MSLDAVNKPRYATVLNGGVGKLGTGASTVAATALGTDGIAADAKVVYTAGAYGGIVESLSLSTDDSSAVNVLVYAMEGSTVHPLGVVPVPALSGASGSALNVDGLAQLQGLPKNSVYKPYIPLRANMTLKIAVLANMTVNKILFAKATGVDFVA
jgi:hypothetical protein